MTATKKNGAISAKPTNQTKHNETHKIMKTTNIKQKIPQKAFDTVAMLGTGFLKTGCRINGTTSHRKNNICDQKLKREAKRECDERRFVRTGSELITVCNIRMPAIWCFNSVF